MQHNSEPQSGQRDRRSLIKRSAVGANVLSGTGLLDRGNLQVHEGLGRLEHDCSGC